jgi:molybdate transport repressor ModE-like protein
MFQLRLQCSWLAGPDGTQPLDPMLFPLLAAIRSTGSLSRAAAEVGFSYRHVWNMVGRWEQLMGHPLVVLEQGRGARLTALGEKLLWAEKRVQGRLAP